MWNAQRTQALYRTFYQLLYPLFTKELVEKLLQEAKDFVVKVTSECCHCKEHKYTVVVEFLESLVELFYTKTAFLSKITLRSSFAIFLLLTSFHSAHVVVSVPLLKLRLIKQNNIVMKSMICLLVLVAFVFSP